MRAVIKLMFVFGLLYIPSAAVADSSKYADAISLHEEFMDIASKLADSIKNSKTSDEVVKALNDYSDKVEVLQPKLVKIANKYPELKNKNSIPKEFKEIEKKAYEVGMKMAEAMQTAINFKDPKITEAIKRIAVISAGKQSATK